MEVRRMRFSLLGFFFAFTIISAQGAFGQTQPYTPERTPEGFPNLEGIWQPQSNGAAYSILPHPPGFLLGAGSKTGVVGGGWVPYQKWAAEQGQHRLAHMEP